MIIPPKYAVSKVVETIKKNTSRSLNGKLAFLKKVYWDRKGIWGKGFFVSTVGIDEEVIRRYAESQEEEEIGDKQSLSFESTTPVKAWVSSVYKRKLHLQRWGWMATRVVSCIYIQKS